MGDVCRAARVGTCVVCGVLVCDEYVSVVCSVLVVCGVVASHSYFCLSSVRNVRSGAVG